MAVLAVGGEIDRIAGASQGRAQLPAQIGLILDDQDPHRIPLFANSGLGQSTRPTSAIANGFIKGKLRTVTAPAPGAGVRGNGDSAPTGREDNLFLGLSD